MRKSELYNELSEKNRELLEKDHVISGLKKDIKRLEGVIEKLQPERSHTQENVCKRGDWCRACSFSKIVPIHQGYDYMTLCMKHMACENFTPVKESSR